MVSDENKIENESVGFDIWVAKFRASLLRNMLYFNHVSDYTPKPHRLQALKYSKCLDRPVLYGETAVDTRSMHKLLKSP